MNKDKILTLKDENGKTFSTSVTDLLFKLSVSDLEEGGSMDVYDADKKITDFPGLTIVDSEGNAFDPTIINDAENRQEIIGLEVLVEATHSGQNANSVAYYSDSMEKDAQSMFSPYKKPLIKNHNTYSEPLGRVLDAYFGPSEFVLDRDTINVNFKVTDQEAIPKFLDGRYNTVSIGGAPGRVTCDICGKDILKDGVFKFCGHWKGETYANKKATWSCRDIVYNEVSVVNNPADKWAQVKKIRVILKEETKEPTGKVGDEEDMKNVNKILDQAEADNLIDNILEDDKKDDPVMAEPSVEDNSEKEPETQVEDTQAEGEGEAVKDEEKTPEQKLEDQEKLIQELNDKLTALEEEKNGMKESLDSMTAEKTELSDKLVAAEAESKAARDQSLRIALKYKNLLVDSVKTVNALVKDALTDEEIESKSIKELSTLADELKEKIPAIHATPTPATNPGVVDNKESNVLKDVEEKETAKTSSVDAQALLDSMIESAAR